MRRRRVRILIQFNPYHDNRGRFTTAGGSGARVNINDPRAVAAAQRDYVRTAETMEYRRLEETVNLRAGEAKQIAEQVQADQAALNRKWSDHTAQHPDINSPTYDRDMRGWEQKGKALFEEQQKIDDRITAANARLNKGLDEPLFHVGDKSGLSSLAASPKGYLEVKQREAQGKQQERTEGMAARERAAQRMIQKGAGKEFTPLKIIGEEDRGRVVSNFKGHERTPQDTEAALLKTAQIAMQVSKIVPLATIEKAGAVNIAYVGSKGRAEYDSNLKVIRVFGNTSEKELVHEYGHHLENTLGHSKGAVGFVEKKATGPPKKLNDLTKREQYQDSEEGYVDHYIHPYAGKVYHHPDRTKTSEVLSMGLQALHENPAKFKETAPDHYQFMMAVLYGGD